MRLFPHPKLEVTVATAPNTWIVHNAWTKGNALWNEMNQLVLADNPSIKGTWHDFKVQLAGSQSSVRTLSVNGGDGVPVAAGEWDISTYVMPQHEVDPVTENSTGDIRKMENGLGNLLLQVLNLKSRYYIVCIQLLILTGR